MKDGLRLGVGEDRSQRRAVPDVGALEVGAGGERRGEVGLVAAGEVVDDRDAVAAGEQRIGEVRADEAGAAGDEGPHAAAESSRRPRTVGYPRLAFGGRRVVAPQGPNDQEHLMNLPTRQNTKRKQALDALASLAKTWSEWRLGEKATKTVAEGTKKASKSAAKARKKAKKAAKKADVKSALKGTPLKVAGAVALVGGIGAMVAKKLKGGGTAEPLYTPPPAPAPLEPPAELKDVPPPPKTSVVVGDLASDKGSEPEPVLVDAAPDDAGDAPVEDAGADADVAASEQAAAAAAEPVPDDVTAPTVPDTEPAAEAETDIPDADDGTYEGAATDTAVTADADAGELEAAPADDGSDDGALADAADDAEDKS